MVLQSKKFFEQDQYNGVIAIGGGSVIDTAKCIAIYGNNHEPLESFFGENKVSQKGLPLIVLPTTAGTGSEVTNIAILSDSKNQIKKGIVSHCCPTNITRRTSVEVLLALTTFYLAKINISAIFFQINSPE
ncbi:MAG: NAD-dependent methanol dehydrogenase [Acinetobacter bereziniae]|uniref:NAD-dependent methanol dehydrogenase n=1 Tax=Acinetobacter bereziniae TaxID=106648 RepID=A0A833PC95_ACIBZ|nr:MAG: NAD-dependent methanol dehydrogenase [Acinetobacter bereziniae]